MTLSELIEERLRTEYNEWADEDEDELENLANDSAAALTEQQKLAKALYDQEKEKERQFEEEERRHQLRDLLRKAQAAYWRRVQHIAHDFNERYGDFAPNDGKLHLPWCPEERRPRRGPSRLSSTSFAYPEKPTSTMEDSISSLSTETSLYDTITDSGTDRHSDSFDEAISLSATSSEHEDEASAKSSALTATLDRACAYTVYTENAADQDEKNTVNTELLMVSESSTDPHASRGNSARHLYPSEAACNSNHREPDAEASQDKHLVPRQKLSSKSLNLAISMVDTTRKVLDTAVECLHHPLLGSFRRNSIISIGTKSFRTLPLAGLVFAVDSTRNALDNIVEVIR